MWTAQSASTLKDLKASCEQRSYHVPYQANDMKLEHHSAHRERERIA